MNHTLKSKVDHGPVGAGPRNDNLGLFNAQDSCTVFIRLVQK